eukprot:jgi/Mesvir1/29467/Mv23041-RA.4
MGDTARTTRARARGPNAPLPQGVVIEEIVDDDTDFEPPPKTRARNTAAATDKRGGAAGSAAGSRARAPRASSAARNTQSQANSDVEDGSDDPEYVPKADTIEISSSEEEDISDFEPEPAPKPRARKASAKPEKTAGPAKKTPKKQAGAKGKVVVGDGGSMALDGEREGDEEALVSGPDSDESDSEEEIDTEDLVRRHISMPKCDPPPELLMDLLPFQKQWLAWSLAQEASPLKGGILADEMGMGKTIQAIALIVTSRARQKQLALAAATTEVITIEGAVSPAASPALLRTPTLAAKRTPGQSPLSVHTPSKVASTNVGTPSNSTVTNGSSTVTNGGSTNGSAVHGAATDGALINGAAAIGTPATVTASNRTPGSSGPKAGKGKAKAGPPTSNCALPPAPSPAPSPCVTDGPKYNNEEVRAAPHDYDPMQGASKAGPSSGEAASASAPGASSASSPSSSSAGAGGSSAVPPSACGHNGGAVSGAGASDGYLRVPATLVICPLVAIIQWRSEIATYTAPGSVRVLVYHGSKRELDKATLGNYDVVLTTYSIVEAEHRKHCMPDKEPCQWCGRKFYPDRLRVHLRFFCGPDAQRSAALMKTQKKRKRAYEMRGGQGGDDDDDDEDDEDYEAAEEEDDDEDDEDDGPRKKSKGAKGAVKGKKDSKKKRAAKGGKGKATHKGEKKKRKSKDESDSEVAEGYETDTEDESDREKEEEEDEDDDEDGGKSGAKGKGKAKQAKGGNKGKLSKGKEEVVKTGKGAAKGKGKGGDDGEGGGGKGKAGGWGWGKRKFVPFATMVKAMAAEAEAEGAAADPKGKGKAVASAAGGSALHSVHWTRIVLDEAHSIKDRRSSTAKAVFALRSDFKWALSGTPLQNRVGELYSLIRYLRLDPYAFYMCNKCPCKSLDYSFGLNWRKCDHCDHSPLVHFCWWNRHIANPIKKHGYAGPGRKAMLTLKNRVLDCALLRRTKEQCADDLSLPPRKITIRRDQFDVREEDFYSAMYTQSQSQFNTFVASGTVLNNYAHIFDLLIRLRQAVNHPYLVVYAASAATREAETAGASSGAPSPSPSSSKGKRVAGKKGAEEADVSTQMGDVADSGDCGLCHDPLEDRVVTVCGHAFCRMCLMDFLGAPTLEGGDANADASTLRDACSGATCPVCQVALSVDFTGAGMASGRGRGGAGAYASGGGGRSSAAKCILQRFDTSQFKTSTKIEALREEIMDMRARDCASKCIVFSQFTSMLALIQFRLEQTGIRCVRLDGSMSLDKRNAMVDAFTHDPSVHVFLMSLKAGGVALNLTVASQVEPCGGAASTRPHPPARPVQAHQGDAVHH